MQWELMATSQGTVHDLDWILIAQDMEWHSSQGPDTLYISRKALSSWTGLSGTTTSNSNSQLPACEWPGM